ncbi:SH3 domain-containing protein [Novosphingobium sp.]|uniref:SH3 domain-containing protein n=1 Tax=Novosphingobium sp. TaxID=1874826 RepID=UPI0022C571BD|nr:SH3 domain-containing protein [Novosphingobium sp.]MCZ8019276.1 SH3 domain-containing protein [Novosphingobium sp.]MCZ8035091.1 SH3 domain-containing protein [Novosphingobium sp.]MCZ8050405.1 SH3 domain-containing protein [Novosphingobium sp.]MCZ8232196.1 SH3 domain-containing protein [Novosphingobium sp.]MCZ8262252.1 SH3 domain-containing protein [Novosphingobium sp.]
MDNLLHGASGANRPVFQFSGQQPLTVTAIPEGQYGLNGPAEKLDAAHWPVRGDLAHIRLAGRCFVPHYAVPMPRKVVAAGANLLAANKADAEVREALAGGTMFNLLDVTGGWAWGQVGEDGFVGYLPVEALEADERRS